MDFMREIFKKRIMDTLSYDLAIFIDIFVSEKVKNNFDWVNYFIYRNVINYKYLVNGHCLYLNDFIIDNEAVNKPKNKIISEDKIIKNFLDSLGDYFKSEELFLAVKKELKDIKNER